MSLVGFRTGCKVAWDYYDDETEAKAAAVQASAQRERMFKQGYDFGFQWPGAIEHIKEHPEYGECWMVVKP